jgi:hypothetical protein
MSIQIYGKHTDGSWHSPGRPPLGAQPGARMMLGICPDATTNAEFERVEGLIGKRMGIRRCYQYNGTVPASLASSPAAPDIGRRTSWLSISNQNANTAASGGFDTQWRNFAISVGDHPMLLTWNHEPENDGYAASAFRSGFQRFYDVVKAANPKIIVGTIMMEWCFDPLSGLNPASFDPGPTYRDFYGVDTYNLYHFFNNQSQTRWVLPTDPDWGPGVVNRVQRFFDYNESHGNQQVAVGEFGTPNWNTSGDPNHPPDNGVNSPVGTRKAEWIDAMLRFFEARNCIAMCYFNTDVNNDYEPSAFIEADAPSRAVWASWLATHQAGVL